MSTVIMHTTTSLYDFGDARMKNQQSSRSNLNPDASGNVNSLASTLNSISSNPTSSSVLSNANAGTLFTQQHLNSGPQQPTKPQQVDQQKAIRQVLSRAVSHPQNGNNVVSLVNTLIENLGGGHRKIERTQSEPLPQQVNTSRYKTELCRPFEEAGECKYGEKCQFAHGIHELRSLQRHPKYKTEYCRTFHSVGFCPYGPRCHFVHNQDEARFQQQQLQQQQQEQQAKIAAAVAAQRNSIAINNLATAAYTRLAASVAAQQMQSRQALNLNHLINLTNSNLQQQQQQQHQHQQQQQNQHQLPISPPLSMSTGSDRASPTGSLSPTNSIVGFPFVDQISPNSQSILQSQPFSFNPSPPSSPAQTPSPSPPLGTNVASVAQQLQMVNGILNAASSSTTTTNGIQQHRILQKQNSLNNPTLPIALPNNGSINSSSTGNSLNDGSPIEEARLPVFNRLSKTIDAFNSFNI